MKVAAIRAMPEKHCPAASSMSEHGVLYAVVCAYRE